MARGIMDPNTSLGKYPTNKPACDRCRGQKLRCVYEDLGDCTRCQRAGVECLRMQPRRRGRPSKTQRQAESPQNTDMSGPGQNYMSCSMSWSPSAPPWPESFQNNIESSDAYLHRHLQTLQTDLEEQGDNPEEPHSLGSILLDNFLPNIPWSIDNTSSPQSVSETLSDSAKPQTAITTIPRRHNTANDSRASRLAGDQHTIRLENHVPGLDTQTEGQWENTIRELCEINIGMSKELMNIEHGGQDFSSPISKMLSSSKCLSDILKRSCQTISSDLKDVNDTFILSLFRGRIDLERKELLSPPEIPARNSQPDTPMFLMFISCYIRLVQLCEGIFSRILASMKSTISRGKGLPPFSSLQGDFAFQDDPHLRMNVLVESCMYILERLDRALGLEGNGGHSPESNETRNYMQLFYTQKSDFGTKSLRETLLMIKQLLRDYS